MSLAIWWREIALNHSTATIEFVGISIVQFVCFWMMAAIYMSLPYIFPTFAKKHKLQKQTKPPTSAELQDCLITVTRNQMIYTTGHLVKLIIEAHFRRGTIYRFDPTLPSFTELASSVVFGLLLRETLFYYIHRALHHPSVYRNVHKSHHRFTAPVALAAQYSSAIEHVLANLLPVILPLLLIRSHIVTLWVFLGLELLKTTTVHSGYDFFGKLTAMHDMHHELSMNYFGTIGLLDWIHGTDKLAKQETG